MANYCKAICIKCWDADAVVSIDLDGTRDFHCAGCNETFTADEARAAIDGVKKGWEKLIAWVDAYPVE